jgi:hypothetical protein
MAKKKTINPKKHESHCAICRHTRRAEIEAEFLRWRSPVTIAREFGLSNRQVVFRHARFANLFYRRNTNTREMLVALIEAGMTGRMKPSPATVVQAIAVLSKLDEKGQAVERFLHVDKETEFLNDQRWTMGEMHAFAERGIYPDWYIKDRDGSMHETTPSDRLN